jgi:hypothetical protein
MTNDQRAKFSPLPLTGFVHTRTISVRIVSSFSVVDLHENAPQLRLPDQPYSTEKEPFLGNWGVSVGQRLIVLIVDLRPNVNSSRFIETHLAAQPACGILDKARKKSRFSCTTNHSEEYSTKTVTPR